MTFSWFSYVFDRYCGDFVVIFFWDFYRIPLISPNQENRRFNSSYQRLIKDDDFLSKKIGGYRKVS